MKKTLLGFSVASFVVVVAAACGGGNTNENTNTTPPTQDASAATTASATPAQDAGPAENPALAAQHDPFMAVCLHNMPQAYCDCAFGQFKEFFKDFDFKSKPPDSQMDALRTQTTNACSSKLTDADVKTVFANECLGGNTKKQAWCDCEYTALRSKLQIADFLLTFEGPKYDDAKKVVVTQCKGKLTEADEKADFAAGCSKGAPDRAKVCDCMWKKLRSKLSVEEIAAVAFDPKKAGLETCKTQ